MRHKINIIIYLFVLLFLFTIYKYKIFQDFKKSEHEYYNLAHIIWAAHENYFWQLYKNPTDIKDLMYFMKTYKNSETTIINLPYFVKKNGLFIDCNKKNNSFCVYTINHKDVKKFSNDKCYEIKDINFYTFLFKDIKIYIYKSVCHNLCSVNNKKLNLIYNNNHINNKSKLYYQVYHEIKKLKFPNKKFLPTKVYLYGVKQNNNFNFSVLCKNNSANYKDILIKTDSIINSTNFKDSIDEIYLPIKELADTVVLQYTP